MHNSFLNKKLADFGEKIAEEYLIRKGYSILERNAKISYQEIDIITSIKEKIVFVEVKTRASYIYGKAEDCIYPNKIKNLKKGVNKYINDRNIDPENVRIDFIAIDINKKNKIANIKHFLNIT